MNTPKSFNQKLIIAEVGSVHDGSFGNAIKIISAAAKSGADCVKFQTHIFESESLSNAPSPKYFSDENRDEYFNRTAFNFDQWKKLKEECERQNIIFLSSPFSNDAVDLLEELNVFGYKIPSGEVTNIPLIEKIANIGKPVFISSGMSDWKELDRAVKIISNNCEIVIMQCSSIYPCPKESVGLNVIGEIKKRYSCAVGYSDHYEGIEAAIAAAALGATVIEKHFTFSKQMYGTDAQFATEPNEFSIMTKYIKNVWSMNDNPVDKNYIKKYNDMKKIFEKSIVASSDLKKGTIIEKQHLDFKKPGNGISSSKYDELIGLCIKKDMLKDEQFNIKHLE